MSGGLVLPNYNHLPCYTLSFPPEGDLAEQVCGYGVPCMAPFLGEKDPFFSTLYLHPRELMGGAHAGPLLCLPSLLIRRPGRAPLSPFPHGGRRWVGRELLLSVGSGCPSE